MVLGWLGKDGKGGVDRKGGAKGRGVPRFAVCHGSRSDLVP